jgi:uncharacterized membrane protein
MKNVSTIKLVLTALFMALTTVSTMFIRIPLPLGYVNLGDAFVLLSVFVLGGFYGTIAGGIGSALADLIGYITYAPGTLVIKTAMAIVAYIVYKLLLKATKSTLVSQIVAGVVGAVIMAFGYFFYEIIFFCSAGVAIINVPYNLIQGAVGVAIATVVMQVLRATKILEKLK